MFRIAKRLYWVDNCISTPLGPAKEDGFLSGLWQNTDTGRIGYCRLPYIFVNKTIWVCVDYLVKTVNGKVVNKEHIPLLVHESTPILTSVREGKFKPNGVKTVDVFRSGWLEDKIWTWGLFVWEQETENPYDDEGQIEEESRVIRQKDFVVDEYLQGTILQVHKEKEFDALREGNWLKLFSDCL